MVSGHLYGNRNYTVEIHKLLTLELVHRLFTRGSADFGASSGDSFEPEPRLRATHGVQ